MGKKDFEEFFARVDELNQMQMEARSKELNKGNWSGKRIAGIEERIARFNLTRGGIERLVENMEPSPVFFDGDAL